MTKEAEMLLPCPFCGSDQQAISRNAYDGLLRVKCEGCWATSVTSNQRATVVAAWNTRAAAVPAPDAGLVEREAINVACEAYADATDYYVKFHRGLSSASADRMRKGMEAALKAAALLSRSGAGEPRDDITDLVERFSAALLEKLRETRRKGKSGWEKDDWMRHCQQALLDHLAKGDPRDIAAYCAFMWHHGWPTVAAVAGEPVACEDDGSNDPIYQGQIQKSALASVRANKGCGDSVAASATPSLPAPAAIGHRANADAPAPQAGRDPATIATVQFIRREGGGLRVCSDDMPGLILSGSDADAVAADVWPALRALTAPTAPTVVTDDGDTPCR